VFFATGRLSILFGVTLFIAAFYLSSSFDGERAKGG